MRSPAQLRGTGGADIEQVVITALKLAMHKVCELIPQTMLATVPDVRSFTLRVKGPKCRTGSIHCPGSRVTQLLAV